MSDNSATEHPNKAHRSEASNIAATAATTSPQQQQQQQQRTVVLRHLKKAPPLVSEADLRALAEVDFGAVEGVTVLTHGGLVGTAFVDFADTTAATTCVRQLSDPATPEAASWQRFAADHAVAITAELKAPRTSSTKINEAASASPVDADAAAAAAASADGPQLNRKQRRALARKHLSEEHRSTASSQQQQHPNKGEEEGTAAAAAASSLASSSPSTPTLYVRGKYVAAIFDVFTFFKQHGVEGQLKNCVFVTTSRKPYFLVDCTGNKAFFTAALAINGSAYKGEAVTVSPSAQTCDDYLLKKPDAVCSKKIEHNGSGFDKGNGGNGGGDGKKGGFGGGDGGGRGKAEPPEPATTAPDMEPEQTAEAAAASLAFKPRMLRKR